MGEIRDWVRLLRPKQWLKNGFVLAPVLFGGKASQLDSVLNAVLATAIFSALASGVYLLNDVYDREEDGRHPKKKNRPVASGRIPPHQAAGMGVSLAVTAIAGAWALDPRFGGIAIGYAGLNVLYTLRLKSVVLLDVFTIAGFFLLRLLAGAAVVDVRPSLWLLLCGGLLALFLGFTKRKSEIMALGGHVVHHRAVLVKYDRHLLDQISGVLLSVTVVSYIMFTLNSETALRIEGDALSYSVAFVLYGVFRYLYLTREDVGGDAAETVLSDRPLLASVVAWALYCGWLLYGG